MRSDELFPEVTKTPAGWDGLEKRINRLLESVVQLRNSNGQLMKENMALKNQLREASSTAADSAETEKLRREYTRTLEDLRKLQKNLAQMEKLTAELRGRKVGEAEAS